MNLFKSSVKNRIEHKDYAGLKQLLVDNPSLANKAITIPFDFWCIEKAHPLHRICDAVFSGKITDNEALKLAQVFLEHGANIDGDKYIKEGTPLLAAASLHAEQVGIFYIENGADVFHTYKNDGVTALHWAAFCGRDKLVEKLIDANVKIDLPDKEYQSTPLGWAIYTLLSEDAGNKHNQIKCIKLLLNNGADARKLEPTQFDYLRSLAIENPELQKWVPEA